MSTLGYMTDSALALLLVFDFQYLANNWNVTSHSWWGRYWLYFRHLGHFGNNWIFIDIFVFSSSASSTWHLFLSSFLMSFYIFISATACYQQFSTISTNQSHHFFFFAWLIRPSHTTYAVGMIPMSTMGYISDGTLASLLEFDFGYLANDWNVTSHLVR